MTWIVIGIAAYVALWWLARPLVWMRNGFRAGWQQAAWEREVAQARWGRNVFKRR